MISCREARSRILPAIDRTLGIERVFELEEHVRECANCRVRYEEARALDEALVRVPEPSIDRLDLDRAVRLIGAAIDRERAPAPPAPRSGPVRRWVWITGGAIAAGFLAFFFLFEARDRMGTGVAPGHGLVEVSRPSEGHVEVADSTAPAEEESIAPVPIPDTSAPADVDRTARLERARQEVRCLLAEAANRLPSPGDLAPATALADRFDEGARDLAREGWPVLRLVEGDLVDPDPAIGRAAARYLGLRGDRFAMRALEGALALPELRTHAVLALCDAGPAGEDGLAAALRDRGLRSLVFARLSERRDERAVLLIEEAVRDVARLRDTRGGSVRLLEAIDTLASTGAVAAPAFLRMASDGTLSRAEVVDALARTEGAAGAIAGFVRSRPRGIQDGVALAAIAALQPKGALPLLERRCLEQRERRMEALEVLASYGDRDALEALVRIAASGRIPSAEIEAPIRMVLATSRDAGRTVVEEATRAGRRVELLVLQQILASTPTSASAPALIALGGSHLLPSSDRRWSILLAGETGIPADAEAVAQLFWSSRSADRDVRAACLIAIQNLGGPARLERFAETLPRRVAERVIALLATRESKDRPASILSRLARELETALAPLAP